VAGDFSCRIPCKNVFRYEVQLLIDRVNANEEQAVTEDDNGDGIINEFHSDTDNDGSATTYIVGSEG